MKIKKLAIVLIVVGIVVIAGGIVLMNNSPQTEDFNSYSYNNPPKTGMEGGLERLHQINEASKLKSSNIDFPIKLSPQETLIVIGAVVFLFGIIWNFSELLPASKTGKSPDTETGVAQKYCPSCGNPLKPGLEFCTNCGAKIS